MSRNLFWLSDEQWKRIEPFLPTDVRGVERVDDRRVISGIVQVLKSGCRWCDCPAAYGPPTTIYNRFVRWARRGIWENLFRNLAGTGSSANTQMIDSTHVKAHRSAAGGKGGSRSRQLAAQEAGATQRSMHSQMLGAVFSYRALASRRQHIPKADGRQRPHRAQQWDRGEIWLALQQVQAFPRMEEARRGRSWRRRHGNPLKGDMLDRGLLDIFENFILFDDSAGEFVKIVAQISRFSG